MPHIGLEASLVVGSWAWKRIVDRFPEHVFVLLIEVTMTAAGLLFPGSRWSGEQLNGN
jgi:hypothetical protein